MINLTKLEQEREEATSDKSDLFDFYHKNWPIVINEINRLMDKLEGSSISQAEWEATQ